jgi:predicted permease
MPALNLHETLKDTGPGLSGGRQRERMRAFLVVSEVSMACILLVSAGLLLRSFLRLLEADLGFQPARIAAVKIDYNDRGNAAYRNTMLRQILERAKAIPGIDEAAITNLLPLERTEEWGLWSKERSAERNKEASSVEIVSPGYLKTMGIRLVKGRDFSWEDTLDREHVVIINETLARYDWPGIDPVGRMAEPGDRRVIGVVSDVHEISMEAAPGREFFLPLTQQDPRNAELVVRTNLPPDVLASSVLRELRELNPEQPASEFRTIRQLVDHAASPRRFFALLVSVFAGLGLLLASLGIYGVISYSVTRRTQEIGIRMALGAVRRRVQLDVIWETLRLALVGIGVGTIASFAVARLISSLLFGTSPTDPLTFFGIAVLLVAVALLAGYLPARRASKIDPMIALRTN